MTESNLEKINPVKIVIEKDETGKITFTTDSNEEDTIQTIAEVMLINEEAFSNISSATDIAQDILMEEYEEDCCDDENCECHCNKTEE